MRSLVIGDSHGSLPMVREAARAAQFLAADTVVSVGDFGIWPGSGGKEFLDMTDRIAAARNVGFYIVPGNHDDYHQISSSPIDDDGWVVLRARVKAAPRGHSWRWGPFTWLGFGGAASIDGPDGPDGLDGWPQLRGPLDRAAHVRNGHGTDVLRPAGWDLGGWWPEERITDRDVDRALAEIARVHEAGQQVDVMISHEAPVTLPLTGTHHKPVDWPVGNEQRERLQTVHDAARPAVHLCGHWHRYHDTTHDERFIATLAADVTPNEPQWVLLDTDTDRRPRLRTARPWGPDAALTATAWGRPVSRHRIGPFEPDELRTITPW